MLAVLGARAREPQPEESGARLRANCSSRLQAEPALQGSALHRRRLVVGKRPLVVWRVCAIHQHLRVAGHRSKTAKIEKPRLQIAHVVSSLPPELLRPNP